MITIPDNVRDFISIIDFKESKIYITFPKLALEELVRFMAEHPDEDFFGLQIRFSEASEADDSTKLMFR